MRTKQLAMNLSGYAQAALPLLGEERAHAELLALARADAAPPVLPKTAPVRDVVLAVARSEPYKPFVRESDTSQEAAETLSDEAAERQAAMALAYLRRCGAVGATDMEIAAAHPDQMASSMRRARRGLVVAGLAVKGSETRLNRDSGKRCRVWLASEHVQIEAAA